MRTTADTPAPVHDAFAAGRAALARGSWAEARERFEAALAEAPSAAAWEGLSWAAWWLSDADLTLAARERAFRAHRDEGDPAAAAGAAGWLASDLRDLRGDEAMARGWLERARRLLEGRPEGAEHGWLALHEGSYVLNVDHDPTGAAALARRASRLGRTLGVPDLEAVGLALEGIALVLRAEVEEGMRRLDEASAIAAGDDLQLPVSTGWALCYVVAACEGVGDFPRAVQWCTTMQAHAERWSGRRLAGVCRSAYGRVLATSGDWPRAEAELHAAIADLEASAPALASSGHVRLAELRACQGRTDEARVLYERAGAHPTALLGLGALALAEGDAATAVDAAERVLRRLPESSVLDRVPALELLVRARAAAGANEAAAAACAELERAGRALGTAFTSGRARLAAAELAAACGDHEEARRACEDALDRFVEGGAPYDAAQARLALARALQALDRTEAAAAEARRAAETFAALGAERPGAPPVAAQPLGDLSARELEVLRLVASGLSDAEIAERLVLSPHTVHRHVANVRAKLRLPSRAAAVALAARQGLL